MYKYHEIIKINNINDKEEILNTLSFIGTDEDFNGNNGKEYTREEAIEKGFESTQEYVIDKLEKSNLTGKSLVIEFFKEWLDNDGYYDMWDIESNTDKNNSCIFSVFAIHED